MKKSTSIIWGICFTCIGIIFSLNALGITNINIFFNGWWTFVIIIPCLVGLFTSYDKLGNLAGLGIGTVLLLVCRDVISFRLVAKLILPLALIFIGISLIVLSFNDSSRQSSSTQEATDETANEKSDEGSADTDEETRSEKQTL